MWLTIPELLSKLYLILLLDTCLYHLVNYSSIQGPLKHLHNFSNSIFFCLNSEWLIDWFFSWNCETMTRTPHSTKNYFVFAFLTRSILFSPLILCSLFKIQKLKGTLRIVFLDTKGQLISQCPFGVYKSPKKPMIFFQDFFPSL